MADQVKLAERYGASEHGNFYVMDTIGVPHPYCIGARHVAHAADRFGGILGEPAIRSAEMAGIHCSICKGKLTYDQHEIAALISCKCSQDELNASPDLTKELNEYLQAIKDKATEDGYAGFAFVRAK
jgi:hypothetical protein